MKSVGRAFQNKGTACMEFPRDRRVWHVQRTTVRKIISGV